MAKTPNKWTQLDETPDTLTADQYVKVNAGGTALELGTVATDADQIVYDPSSAPGLDATDVQAALDELDGDKASTVQLNNGTVDHVNLASKGTNTHAQIDAHLADAAKHYNWTTDLGSTNIHVNNVPQFTSSTPGIVPSSGGSPTNYLAANGTWSSPTVGSAVQLTVTAQKASAGTISAGQVVYITNFDTGAGVVEVELAQADSVSTMPGYGIASSTIEQAVSGTVVVSGTLTGQDTSSFAIGDALYISDSVAGGLTATAPTGATDVVQPIGICARQDAVAGVIQIFGAGDSHGMITGANVHKETISSIGPYTIADFNASLLGGPVAKVTSVTNEAALPSAGNANVYYWADTEKTLHRDNGSSIDRVGYNTGAVAYTYDASTTMADPGTGAFRINATDDAIAISKTALNAITFTNILAGLTSGHYLMLRDGAGGSDVYKVVGAPTVNSTWVQATIENQGTATQPIATGYPVSVGIVSQPAISNIGPGTLSDLSAAISNATFGGVAEGDVPSFSSSNFFSGASDIGTPASGDRIPIQDDTDDSIKWVDWDEVGGSIGTMFAGIWEYGTTGVSPTTNKFNAPGGPTKANVTSLVISTTPLIGVGGASIISRIDIGDIIYLQKSGSPSTQAAMYEVTAVSTSVTGSFTVTYIGSIGDSAFSANDDYILVLVKAYPPASNNDTTTNDVIATSWTFAPGGLQTARASTSYLVTYSGDWSHSAAGVRSDVRLATFLSGPGTATPVTNAQIRWDSPAADDVSPFSITALVTLGASDVYFGAQAQTASGTLSFGDTRLVGIRVST
jgi:hypothetical protein